MPEGHTIHRHARLQRKLLVGEPVRAWSPQGRFEHGAARLDGLTVTDIQAHGKHLLYHWADADGGSIPELLHVHLGLFGRFRTFAADPAPPTEGTRLALQTGGSHGTPATTLYLAGATIVQLITPAQAEVVIARLGPDPLQKDADPARFVQNLTRRTLPIGAALLDQKAIAGIGNVYRAELLFRAGVDPDTPANRITEATAKQLWDDAIRLLTWGEKSGRIVTVDPIDVSTRRRSDLRGDQQRYVYKRHDRPCHRCGTPIIKWQPRTRTIWGCPSCQHLSRTR